MHCCCGVLIKSKNHQIPVSLIYLLPIRQLIRHGDTAAVALSERSISSACCLCSKKGRSGPWTMHNKTDHVHGRAIGVIGNCYSIKWLKVWDVRWKLPKWLQRLKGIVIKGKMYFFCFLLTHSELNWVNKFWKSELTRKTPDFSLDAIFLQQIEKI